MALRVVPTIHCANSQTFAEAIDEAGDGGGETACVPNHLRFPPSLSPLIPFSARRAVSELEYVKYMLVAMQKVDGALIDELRKQFHKLDPNGDGQITQQDLQVMTAKRTKKVRFFGVFGGVLLGRDAELDRLTSLLLMPASGFAQTGIVQLQKGTKLSLEDHSMLPIRSPDDAPHPLLAPLWRKKLLKKENSGFVTAAQQLIPERKE